MAQKVRELVSKRGAQKEVKAPFLESEEKNSTLFEQSRDAICITSREGRLLDVNRAFKELFGYTKDEMVGNFNVRQLYVNPRDRDRFQEKIEQKGYVRDYGIRLRKKSGEVMDCLLTSTVRQSNDGRILGYQGIIRDVTKYKRAQEALRKKTYELGERVRELNCLYRISEIVENQDLTLEEILQGIVDCIPPALQYPEMTCACILFEGQKFRTKNFNGTSLKHTGDIVVHGRPRGTLDVYCLDEYRGSEESPFLGEEIELINSIALRLGKIIEHKRMGDALRESELRYRTLFGSAPIGIGLANLDGRILECNDTMLELLGYSEPEISRINLKDVYKNHEDHLMFLKHLENDGFIRDFEVILKGKNAHSYHASLTMTKFALRGEETFLIVIQDISDRKQAEEHIRALTQELIKTQEIERQRISLDLHDHVAQDLSTLRIACETLFDNHQAVPQELKQKVSQFSKMLQGSIMDVRDLAYDLRPASLDEMGLVEAVFRHCEDFSEKNGIRVDFYSAGIDNLNMAFDSEISLYRLIQEALNNIKKHANASRATVRLVASYPSVILRIEDDGKGFDVKNQMAKALNDKRMGLRSMQERVNLLRGEMTIQSRPLQGTKIFIKFPYR